MVVLLYSCNRPYQATYTSESINLTTGFIDNKQANLSSLCDSIHYVKLETNDTVLLSKIDKVKFSKNYIFISDKEKLLMFDGNGKFLRQVSKRGKGPGEYISISDFDISTDGNMLYILDISLSRVSAFNVKGDFIKMYKFKYPPSRVVSHANGNILFYYPKPKSFKYGYSIAVFNSEFQKIKDIGIQNNKSKYNLTHSSYTIYKRNDSICFIELCDTTMNFVDENNKMGTKYKFHYKNRRLEPAKNLKELHNPKDTYYDILRVYEVNNYLFITGEIPFVTPKKIIYNKKQKNVLGLQDYFESKKNGIINDIDGGINFWPKGYVNNNALYTCFYAFDIKNRPKVEDKLIKSKKLMSIINESSITIVR